MAAGIVRGGRTSETETRIADLIINGDDASEEYSEG
jgi:hypothetical protein